jgi:hypothetical protein
VLVFTKNYGKGGKKNNFNFFQLHPILISSCPHIKFVDYVLMTTPNLHPQ